jgi:translation elongation factor EF-1alpha
MREKEIGKITHYFTNIGVGVIELSKTLKVGDKVKIKGATTDFEQVIDSMQVDKAPVEKAKKGNSIGLKLEDKVRQGDIVFKVKE